MKKKSLIALAMSLFILSASGQKSAIDLTFTAVDSVTYIQIDSIRVMNRSQGGNTVLYWPDTVLSIYAVGVPETDHPAGVFQVFQNYPNPSEGQTTISLYVPENDRVNMVISDLTGRIMFGTDSFLEKGLHSFRFKHGGSPVYLFTARWRQTSNSIKILSISPDPDPLLSIEYLGKKSYAPQVKATTSQGFAFTPGDTLLFIGYTGGLQSGIPDNPSESNGYTMQFATNIPCPGMQTVTYEGQIYNTIQVFSQCWIKENLNAGIMINGSQNQTNNGILEKYCHSNSPDSCSKYGGLYQWDEMMQYTTQQGSQGICPNGWHLPTDEEWLVLEGAVDSQFGIGDYRWDYQGLRGTDAGMNLKTASGWQNNGNGTDFFGFSAMPGSYRILSGGFDVTGAEAVWWMSTPFVTDYAWYHNIHFFSPKTGRFADSWSFKEYGFSVRCLRDN